MQQSGLLPTCLAVNAAGQLFLPQTRSPMHSASLSQSPSSTPQGSFLVQHFQENFSQVAGLQAGLPGAGVVVVGAAAVVGADVDGADVVGADVVVFQVLHRLTILASTAKAKRATVVINPKNFMFA